MGFREITSVHMGYPEDPIGIQDVVSDFLNFSTLVHRKHPWVSMRLHQSTGVTLRTPEVHIMSLPPYCVIPRKHPQVSMRFHQSTGVAMWFHIGSGKVPLSFQEYPSVSIPHPSKGGDWCLDHRLG